ncbi:hypothetical protein ON010_g13127 [Phytophthora cinnamomi]|nr:hypothetical protein ON010_g13127 [Phytophthora cinnamomi]
MPGSVGVGVAAAAGGAGGDRRRSATTATHGFSPTYFGHARVPRDDQADNNWPYFCFKSNPACEGARPKRPQRAAQPVKVSPLVI